MIKLSESTFTIIPEGMHVFKIVDARYDKDFGRIELDMVTKEGMKHTERYQLVDNMGEINQGALNVFSYTAKVAMNDFTLKEIDHTDLIDKFIECEVKHNKVPSTKKAGEFVTFINLGDKFASDGWEEEGDKSLEDLLKPGGQPF